MENSEQKHLNLAGETLSPCSREESAHDAQNLFDAMKDEKNRNVALVGPFASGKSTVIQTLIDKYEGKGEKLFKESSGEPTLKESNSYLSHFKTQVVSLAKIGCNNSNKRNSGDKGEENDSLNEWDDEVDNSIEKSILQQFVFSKKKSKLPDSKIGRLGHLIMPSLTISGGIALLAIFSILLVFLFNEIPSLSGENYWPFISYAFFATATLFGGLLLIISNVRNLTIKYSELEISCDTDDSKNSESLFNKFLDEIIYYFRKTKINTVFFEDLERFKNLEIFLKLRELNYLLNNNEELKKSIGKITFVYAINNEMFDCGTDRVKFFDYLYSISPSFTPSNREELLYKGLTEDKVLNWKDFDKESIMILSSYIDDRRMLISVINDLRYSWQKLDEETKKQNNSARQLLALTIYKNKYPQKYAELEKGKGELIEALNILRKIYSNQAEQIKKKRDEIQNELNELIIKGVDDLDRCYCLFLGVLLFKGENSNRDSTDINTPQELPKLLELNYDQFVKSVFVVNRRIQVGKLLTLLPEVNIYLKTTSNQKTSAISCKREELDVANSEYKNLPADEYAIAVRYPESINQSDELTDLLKVLLVHGFIDHNYRNFLYRGMAGFLSPNDEAFLNNVNIKGDLMEKAHLDEPKLIFERLSLSDCKEMNILNFDLIDYLFGADRIENPKEVESIKDQLKLNNEIVKQFIGDYFLDRKERSNKRLLFFLLENRFDVFEILNECGLDDLTMDFLEKYCLIECNPTFIEKQTRIQEVVKCFAKKANECGFYRGMKMEYVSLLSKYGCIVDDLNEITKTEVFKEINRTNMWKINYSNLSILCKHLFPKVPLDELLKKDFGGIRSIDVALCSYLEQNIDQFVSEILIQLPTLNLSQNMIKDIFLSNKISNENKVSIIHKQEGTIDYVKGYSDCIISELLRTNKLTISIDDLWNISSKLNLNDIRVYLDERFGQINLNNGQSFKKIILKLLEEDSSLNMKMYSVYNNHIPQNFGYYYNTNISFNEIRDTNTLLSLIDKMDVNSLRNYSNHINSLNEPKVKAQYFLKFVNQSQQIPSTLALTPRALKIVLEQQPVISNNWHNAIKLGYETEQDGVEELIAYVCDKKIDLGQSYALFAKSGNLSSQKFLLSSQVSFKADLSGKLNVIKMYDDCLKELIEKKSAVVPSGNDSIKVFRFIIKKEKLPFELEHKEGRYILQSKNEN